MNNEISSSLAFNLRSPVNCSHLKVIALYYTLSMVLSLLLNSLVIQRLKFREQKRTKLLASLILMISTLNIVCALVEFPIVIASTYNCGYTL
jgi:hypothetical protein